jgi:hypothetical protein
MSKVHCVWESAEADGFARQNLYAAVQELTELTEGGLSDSCTVLQELKGSLSDIIAPEAAWHRLEFRDNTMAEANKIIEAWRKR